MIPELLVFQNNSLRKGMHMLFICVMFPFAMWTMIHFFADESIGAHMTYVYIGTGLICFIIFSIGVLPQVINKRYIKIAINSERIEVFFTDDCDYELAIKKISKIKINTHAQRTTMKDYFLIDDKEEIYRLPHYYDVPITKIITLLMKLNPQIERVGKVRY